MRTKLRYCRDCQKAHDVAAWPHAVASEPKYDPAAGYDEFLSGPRAGVFQRCRTCGGTHEISHWPHNCMSEQLDLRSDLAAPYVVSDSLEKDSGLNGMKSFADGKHYTSKAKYRADLRARGYVEVGNDPARLRPSKKPRADRKKIKAAVERTASRLGWGA